MAGRNKNKELIKEIKEGNQEILLYLFRKHYAEMKSIFSSFNVRENEIPAQAAGVIVKIWMEIHRNDFSENIDLASYLLNTAKENGETLAAERKAQRKNKFREIVVDGKAPQEIIAECVNVLDIASRQALQWRYAENQTIEQVAEKLKIDVAAANDFLSKAFLQLSSIVKIRMEYAA
jgi:DNA-directed RNA polymerase specialized sigma24 family protein